MAIETLTVTSAATLSNSDFISAETADPNVSLTAAGQTDWLDTEGCSIVIVHVELFAWTSGTGIFTLEHSAKASGMTEIAMTGSGTVGGISGVGTWELVSPNASTLKYVRVDWTGFSGVETGKIVIQCKR